MRLENIVALTHGQLLNNPYVSSFNDIVFQASLVKRGDLYVAYDTKEIPQALANGAYAILFEKPCQITDSELAWIKVQNLDEALFRLLRFRLVEQEVVAYECDEITLQLAFGIDTAKQIALFSGSVRFLIEQFWNIPKKTIVLFYPQEFQKGFFPNAMQFPTLTRYCIEIIEKTLFETSFIFENVYYERFILSPFFIPYLEKLLNFYKYLEIDYKLKKFENLKNFEIVFTSKNFEENILGESQMVLIFEQNPTLLSVEMEFLSRYAPWAKILYILPYSFEAPKGYEYFVYKSKNEILQLLEENFFHFAFIGGESKEFITYAKEKTKKQKQLTFGF